MKERGQRVRQKRRGRDPEVHQRRGGQRVDRKKGMKSQGAALMKGERGIKEKLILFRLSCESYFLSFLGLHLAAPEVLTTNEKIFFGKNVQNNS